MDEQIIEECKKRLKNVNTLAIELQTDTTTAFNLLTHRENIIQNHQLTIIKKELTDIHWHLENIDPLVKNIFKKQRTRQLHEEQKHAKTQETQNTQT